MTRNEWMKDWEESRNLEKVVKNCLEECDIPSLSKGFTYLMQAIMRVIEMDGTSVVKAVLYPEIAKRNKVSLMGVEEHICCAMEIGWREKHFKTLEEFFDCSSVFDQKPTEPKFITVIAHKISTEIIE